MVDFDPGDNARKLVAGWRFARAGTLSYDLEIDRGNSALVDNSDRDPIFGAGLGVTVAKRVNLRAEYEVVEIDALDDSNAVWLTAAWRF